MNSATKGDTMKTLTHRRQNDELGTDIILFAEDGNDHYGDNIWTLNTELPEVTEQLINFAADFYSVDTDEAADLVNPDDIVSDAGAWDDRQFVSDLWQSMEAGAIEMSVGYRTNDGAVVIDREGVELTHSIEEDN
jgi:hypothetical protein